MEVSSQLHTLAILPPERVVPVPIGKEAQWATKTVSDIVAKKQHPCPCQEMNQYNPACSQTL